MMKKRVLLLFILLVYFANIQAQNWYQIGNIIYGEHQNDDFGFSISLSSDGATVVIGSPGNNTQGADEGRVVVFQNNSGNWTQLGNNFYGDALYDELGKSVSINADGTIVAMGASWNDGNGTDSGQVKVFQNNAGSWTQLGSDIYGESPEDRAGTSVSLNADGTIVAIGSPKCDGSGLPTGAVHVFQYDSGNWTQVGQRIDGEEINDVCGCAVSISADGSIIAVGARYNGGNGYYAGHVRVFQNIGGIWSQIGQDIDGEAAGDLFGESVSISDDGTIVAVGASENEGNGHLSGQVRVFQNVSGTWTQLGNTLQGEAVGDHFGNAVSINSDGSVLAVGAINHNNSTGQVYVYQYISGTWTPVDQEISGLHIQDHFGTSVSLSSSGDTVAASSIATNDYQHDSGHVIVLQNPTLDVAELGQTNIIIYPNPSTGYITIENANDYDISILDISGKIVYQAGKSNVSNRQIRLQQTGVYIINFISGTKNYWHKIIVE